MILFYHLLTFLIALAVYVRITHIVVETVAHWQMIAHITFGVVPTASGTGIAALLINASTIRRAVGVENTFGATGFIGIAEVLGQALARANAVPFTTLCKGSARVGIAGLYNLGWILQHGRAHYKGISSVAWLTVAHGAVAKYTALGTTAAETRTGILAAIVDASQR